MQTSRNRPSGRASPRSPAAGPHQSGPEAAAGAGIAGLHLRSKALSSVGELAPLPRVGGQEWDSGASGGSGFRALIGQNCWGWDGGCEGDGPRPIPSSRQRPP